MLDKREAFKVGFVQACVDRGIPVEDAPAVAKVAAELVKEASVWSEFVDDAGDLIKWTANKGGNMGLAALFGGPFVVGGGLGYGAAKLRGQSDPHPDEIKAQEKLEAYRQAIARTKTMQKSRANAPPVRANRPLI